MEWHRRRKAGEVTQDMELEARKELEGRAVGKVVETER